MPAGAFRRCFSDLREDLLACSGSGRISFLLFLRHLYHPGFNVSLHYRIARLFHELGLTPVARYVLAWMRFSTGCDVHYRSKIEGGVLFPHGRGVVIGPGVEIAGKCSIFHNTTIGGHETRPGTPVLREGVNVYPCSVIAGGLEIGAYSRVGPGVYLTESVPPHTRVRPPKPDTISRQSDELPI